MKLEVGMYVRTNEGIGTVQRIYNNKNDCTVKFKKGRVKKWVTIFKASHTLLGNDEEPCLIEVGDYVNGEKVYEKNGHLFIGNWWPENINIKSIVTREQFEQMQYKVGD